MGYTECKSGPEAILADRDSDIDELNPEVEMKLLICTDGSQAAEQSAVLVSRLGFDPSTEYALLGVSETEADKVNLSASMGRIVMLLGGERPGIHCLIRQGHPLEQILAETQEHPYDLVVIGERGDRPGVTQQTLGTTAIRLARQIQAHLLVARNVPEQIGKVLVCTGGEEPSEETVRLGGSLISGLQTEIGVLHVISRVFLAPGSMPDNRVANADTAIAKGTREGHHLQGVVQQLRDSGVKGTVTPLLRHGLVVDEILAEIKSGGYQLLVMGAHHQPGQSRWQGMLLDDVADQLVNHAACSVLIV